MANQSQVRIGPRDDAPADHDTSDKATMAAALVFTKALAAPPGSAVVQRTVALPGEVARFAQQGDGSLENAGKGPVGLATHPSPSANHERILDTSRLDLLTDGQDDSRMHGIGGVDG